MAGVPRIYWRNYDSSDNTTYQTRTNMTNAILFTIEECEFSAPAGKVFKEWNDARNGTGTSYQAGEIADTYESVYAIWESIDISISYAGSQIATMNSSGTKTLLTEGKYCEDDIVVQYTRYSPNLQSKQVSPTTSSQTVSPDSGYDGLSSVTVNAMPSGTAGTPTATKGTVSNHSVSVTPSVTNTTGYITGGTKTGTAVTVSASELVSGTKSITSSGTTDVTNYASASVASGSARTPATTITANPTISINSETGLITASNNKTQSVTPVISTGYVDSGTAGTITVSGSRTYQLLTYGSETWTPSTYTQRILPPGYYTTGSIYVEGSSNLYPYNIKDGVTIFGVTGTYTGDTHIFDYSNDIEYRGFSPDNSSVTCIADWDKGRAWISGHVEWDAGAEVGEIDFTGIVDYDYLIDSYTSTFWLINEWDPTEIVTQGTYSDGVFSVDASYIADPSSTTPYYLVQVD